MRSPLSILCLLAFTSIGAAENRTALIIGCDYQGTGLQLPSPVNDAKAVAAALKTAGFPQGSVTIVLNPDRKKMLTTIEAFGAALAQQGGVGFFYFSGHGCQHEGENYLLPVGASLTYREDLPTEAVSAQRVVTRMEAAKNSVNLLFLDACRTNELPSATKKSSFAKGLATMTGSNILIGFAAKENTPSFDSGSGSYYTNALVKHLSAPGINVFSMLTKVRQDVKRATDDRQEPFLYAGLDEEFAFVPGGGRIPPPPPKGFTNSLGMKFVPVPGTKLLFCIHETRVRDFAAFVDASPSYDYDRGYTPTTLESDGFEEHKNASWKAPGFTQTLDHPVTCVSCEDARMFCAWLSRKEGRTYCLPTDHDWSCAVGIGELEKSTATPRSKHGQIKGAYPWGGSFPPIGNAENLAGREARTTTWPSDYRIIEGYQDRDARTAKVMDYGANKLGIFDMGGNVSEWCDDWIDGLLKAEQNFRVNRGGSWFLSDPDMLLSCNRSGCNTEDRTSAIGFRVVLVVSGD